MAKLIGYIVRDNTGICSLVMGIDEKFDRLHQEYIQKNTVLERMKPNPGEDDADFMLRVADNVHPWHVRVISN